jgi:hypothetical protein
MNKVVGRDMVTLRKGLAEERKKNTEKEEKLRKGAVRLGTEVLRMRAMAEILCQRIAVGQFSHA